MENEDFFESELHSGNNEHLEKSTEPASIMLTKMELNHSLAQKNELDSGSATPMSNLSVTRVQTNSRSEYYPNMSIITRKDPSYENDKKEIF